MLKRFSEFQINELKHSTYFNAARKLRRLGGKHHDRAKRIERHSYIIGHSKDLGEFNLNASLIEKYSKNYLTGNFEKMLFVLNPNESKKDNEDLYKSSPLPIYITSIMIIDPRENFNDDEITDCRAISMLFWGIPSQEERFSEQFELFMIDVPIYWEGETFKISVDTLSFVDMENGILKFADRKSATKFRNVVLSQDNLKKMADGMDSLREFFMEYSEPAEWEKFFEKLKSIRVNELYY